MHDNPLFQAGIKSSLKDDPQFSILRTINQNYVKRQFTRIQYQGFSTVSALQAEYGWNAQVPVSVDHIRSKAVYYSTQFYVRCFSDSNWKLKFEPWADDYSHRIYFT